jgi:metal-responsive CopG/Arc/MetJ family transcriptional regulator
MRMSKIISITLDESLISYIDDLAEANGRSRSNMISCLIKEEMERDLIMEEYARREENAKESDNNI